MKKYFILSILLLTVSTLFAQKRYSKYDDYINKYYKIAIAEQKKYGIPASITLAQGILESAGGESRLAVQGKNHFGVKCGSNWYGKTIREDDDAIGECFRSYNNVAESYKDHSLFLKRQRYAFLFDYEITDYKAWAHGLKRAGYATDPKYPNKLINLIETYELHKFDKESPKTAVDKPKNKPQDTEKLFDYIEIQNNDLRCIHLVEEDTYKNIAKEYNINIKILLYYNDMYKEQPLMRGEYVYLQAKKSKSKKGINKHRVSAGESMHSIAQDYGIKMKALYKLNNLEYGTKVKAGQILILRK